MADKLIYIPNNDESLNYTVCRFKLVVETFDTQLHELINQNSMEVPKVVKSTNRKTLLYNYGD